MGAANFEKSAFAAFAAFPSLAWVRAKHADNAEHPGRVRVPWPRDEGDPANFSISLSASGQGHSGRAVTLNGPSGRT